MGVHAAQLPVQAVLATAVLPRAALGREFDGCWGEEHWRAMAKGSGRTHGREIDICVEAKGRMRCRCYLLHALV